MCRLAAYAGSPIPLRDVVFGGSHSLHRQSYAPREMLSGTVNADGYGVAWYHEGRPVRIAEAVPIWQNPDLEGVLSAVRSPVAAAAVRNTTPGIPANRSGVPPLLHGPWSFTLNGFIADFRRAVMPRLHRAVPDRVYTRLTGASDTEALFLLVLAALEDGLAPRDALAEAGRTALELAGEAGVETQLNLLLTGPEGVVATRASNATRSNSLYTLRLADPDRPGVLLASEPLDGERPWEPVPHDSLLSVRLDGSVDRASLSSRPPDQDTGSGTSPGSRP